MAVDAAQYAGISAEMATSNSYLEVKEFGKDYLDKPPLLFWLSSLSIKIFGSTNFAYKLPSFLFIVVSFYALYRFTLLYYDEKVAKNAVLILATTQAYFLLTNDVRTDAILTSCVLISCWLFSSYFEKGKIINLILASVFVGLAMLAKGPVGIVAILMPLIVHLFYKKEWKKIFSIKWLLVLAIIAIVLLPMSYGLYTQFDLHPEKITNGVKGQKGLYFYYWLQSFGRITGENVWNNNTPWHFFIGTSLWDFFPWFFTLLFALFYKFKAIFFEKKEVPELLSLVGFFCLFSFLSLSKYKLPHYVFVTFPFAAILVADYFSKITFATEKKWKTVNIVFGCFIALLFILYPLVVFKVNVIMIVVFVLLQLVLLFTFQKTSQNILFQLISLVVVLNLFMSFVFYPKLLTFQADAIAGKWVSTSPKKENVFILNKPSHLFNFYSNNPFTEVITATEIKNEKTPFWLYLKEDEFKAINKDEIKIILKKIFKNYPVSKLKLNFLLSSKREEQVSNRYLIKIEH